MDLQKLMKSGAARPAPPHDDVIMLSSQLMSGIPEQLADLYSSSDGFLTPQGIAVYDIGSLRERNSTYEVETYCPDHFLIGDDSGGRGFFVRRNDPHSPVFSSGFGDLEPEGFVEEAASFDAWIDSVS